MTTRTASAAASFKGRRSCRPSAPSIGDLSPTSATIHESVSTTSNRLSLGSPARGCPRACVSASGQAPSAARRDLRPPSTEWWCPLQGHTSRASWVRGQIDVKRRTGLLPGRLLAARTLPQPEFCSDTFCRRLVAAPAGEADVPGRFRVLLRTHRGTKPGPVSRTGLVGTHANLLSRSSRSLKTLLSRGLSGTRAASRPSPRRG